MVKVTCFTGHRPNRLNGYDPQDNLELLNKLKEVVIEHIENGVTTFISGMALGIDMWAARIVLKLKETTQPHIKLIAAVPCEKQYSKWHQKNIDEWHNIISKADEVVYVSNESYTSWCMQKRNEWMVDNSDYVIAVWNGENGGTGNCVKYAKKKELEITYIHPKTLEVTK